ncbi:protein CREG1 [Chelonus insularis]|uniref:protein CREG1 n=1 Tax=Chelonus insularis TaxID=460826 RepID=UPI00158BB983|nr:protein CREG1 [Chelonus insularis]
MARHLLKTVTFIPLFLIITVCLLSHCANGRKRYSPTFADNERLLEEFKEFLEWKQSSQVYHYQKNGKKRNSRISNIQDDSHDSIYNLSIPQEESVHIPPSDHPALVGRYVVNQSNWTSVATISRQKEIATFPFANVVAVSDGPLGHGSGVPYMYLTPLDFTSKDLSEDSRATLMMTLAQTSYCQEHKMEPIDPRCARIILSGKIKPVHTYDPMYETAKNAIFGRHPSLKYMPADHDFYFARLKISFIAVLDYFGGAKFVSVSDYFNPPQSLQSSEFNTEESSEEINLPSREVHIY